MEEYERGDFAFEQFIAETIRENPYEVDEFVEFNTEQYDHKRGNCTVSAEFTTTIANLKEGADSATGWTATTLGLMVSRKSASRATATAFSRAATAEAVTGAARMQRGSGS